MIVEAQLKSMDLAMFARASEGLSHGRGIVVSFSALVLGGGVAFLGLYAVAGSSGIGATLVLAICTLLSLLIAGTGISATGVMLLDRARSLPARSISDALVFGLICFLKSLVIGLAVLAAATILSLWASILYFICKIPGVGPILLFFVHPVLVIIAGLFAFLVAIFAALAAPALWDGDSITQAMAKTVAILKERAVPSVLYLLAMALVTAIILSVFAGVVLPGYASMTGLAAQVLGEKSAGNISLFADLPLALVFLASGHMTALVLSSAVLAMLCVAAALQVQLMGFNLVYLGVSAGVDYAGAESMFKQQLHQAKARADEAKQRAMAAAERARQAAQQARASAPTPASGTESGCPHCQAAVAPDDAFCENCGHKLK